MTLPRGNFISRPLTRFGQPLSIQWVTKSTVEGNMIEDAEITLRQILRAISRLNDAELFQLKAAARKEAEKRGLKESRHSVTAEPRRQ
jgi:hypothetical protein